MSEEHATGEERAASRARGQAAYHRGESAEQSVERLYLQQGKETVARRWRGAGGEIDLIMRDGDYLVFIEVKAGRDHACAALRLQPRQMARICMAAAEFLEGEPRGQLTPARFDVALVDGQGRIEIIENAFAA